MTHRPGPLLPALALALAALTGAVRAQPPEDMVQIEILPGWVAEDGSRIVGLRLRLAPGWKTYWRSPGDAGIPPLFDWSGSENIAAAHLHWPAPHVFEQFGMQSIGYSGDVVIPIALDPVTPGAAQRMVGAVDIGVCHDICVPVHFAFDLALPTGGRRDPGIIAALIDQPATAAVAGVSGAQCAAEQTDSGLRLTARLTLPPTGGTEFVVVEAGDPAIWVSQADTLREGADLVASVDLSRSDGGAMALDRESLRFTVLGDDRVVDIVGCTAG